MSDTIAVLSLEALRVPIEVGGVHAVVATLSGIRMMTAATVL